MQVPAKAFPKRLPKDLADEALNALMRDPRYFDGNAPGHDAYVDFMRAGFETVHGEHAEVPDSRDEELAEGLRRMDPRKRLLLLLEILRGEIARRHGIGPDGPESGWKTSGGMREDADRSSEVNIPPKEVIDDSLKHRKMEERVRQESPKLKELQEKAEKGRSDQAKPRKRPSGRFIGDPWMFKRRGIPWRLPRLWE